MEQVYLSWSLFKRDHEKSLERYCPNCGKKVVFQDSLIRRHNANGKNIYKFAIYKCPEDHTWNRKLAVYKARSHQAEQTVEKEERQFEIETINMEELFKRKVKMVVIEIAQVEGSWRLDKLLSQQIENASRTQIVKWMKEGVILVNGDTVKSGVLLKRDQKISIRLGCYKVINDE
ncbi:S4 domain-containing protein [Evansella halocellulosilytica]|uniref:S4 domain-containing protein n=1 Tax=Evansella halocellulosilytica TaxID=2011013 RepID=UPI000BB6ECB7|nr:S4 domain-containing protein [Evansella halocellulosilytica]